jgi:hypothetical protein
MDGRMGGIRGVTASILNQHPHRHRMTQHVEVCIVMQVGHTHPTRDACMRWGTWPGQAAFAAELLLAGMFCCAPAVNHV